MKNFWKISGIVVLATGTASLMYYWYKKEMQKIDQDEEKLKNDVSDAGISLETLRKEVTDIEKDEGNSFIKAVATGLFMNEKVPMEYLDVDDALAADSVIHLRETVKRGQRFFEMLFELPNYAKEDTDSHSPQSGRGSVRKPKLGDYIRCIRDKAEEINNDIVKGPSPRVCPELYVAIQYVDDASQSFKNENDISASYFYIPKDVYKAYADEVHDGLDGFYTDMIKNKLVQTEEFKALLEKAEIIPIAPELYRVVDLVVMINVSFKINNVGGGFGVSILNAPKVVCNFVENLEVNSGYNKGSKGVVRFENVIIHPNEAFQSEEGEEIPYSLYERDSEGRIVRSSYR